MFEYFSRASLQRPRAWRTSLLPATHCRNKHSRAGDYTSGARASLPPQRQERYVARRTRVRAFAAHVMCSSCLLAATSSSLRTVRLLGQSDPCLSTRDCRPLNLQIGLQDLNLSFPSIKNILKIAPLFLYIFENIWFIFVYSNSINLNSLMHRGERCSSLALKYSQVSKHSLFLSAMTTSWLWGLTTQL